MKVTLKLIVFIVYEIVCLALAVIMGVTGVPAYSLLAIVAGILIPLAIWGYLVPTKTEHGSKGPSFWAWLTT